jgi:hypothetical protein
MHAAAAHARTADALPTRPAQIGQAGPVTTGFSLTDAPTSGVASVVTTQARSMMRLNSVVAGNVNWGYSSAREWTNIYECTGVSAGAFCYTALGCVTCCVSSPPPSAIVSSPTTT